MTKKHPGPFDVLRRVPQTGQLKGFPANTESLSAIETARLLAQRGFDIRTLDTYAVRAADGFIWPAENFLEAHPAETVIACWTAGTPQEAGARQQDLHSRWPNLATALDNLDTNYEEEG